MKTTKTKPATKAGKSKTTTSASGTSLPGKSRAAAPAPKAPKGKKATPATPPIDDVSAATQDRIEEIITGQGYQEHADPAVADKLRPSIAADAQLADAAANGAAYANERPGILGYSPGPPEFAQKLLGIGPARAPKAKGQKAPPAPARIDSKQAQAVALLQRPEGAGLKELMETFDWKRWTVRGFVAGAIKTKLGYQVESTKDGADRRYRIVGGGPTLDLPAATAG